MQRQENTRSEWGPGPWDNEPDREEWRYKGLACLARRNTEMGIWCGYVAVPPGHPWHGKTYSDLEDLDNCPNVHGGLTYSAGCQDDICHKAADGEPDNVWWLGFDCGHYLDLVPSYETLGLNFRLSASVYRDLNYVKYQCQSLADQIVAAA